MLSVKEEGHVHWPSGTAFTERMPQIELEGNRFP